MRKQFNEIVESWYIPFSGGFLFTIPFIMTLPIEQKVISFVLGISSLIYVFTKDRTK